MNEFINRNLRVLQFCAYILVAAAAIFASARTFQIADQTRGAVTRIEREGIERRDQSCRGDEQEHLNEVTRLIRLYEYLDSLPTRDYRDLDPINQAVIRNVPETEVDAKTDTAPEFCDLTRRGPNGEPIPVGLPEPDPSIPKRPESVDRLLSQAQADQAQRHADKPVVGDIRGK